jgi:redox-sensitive bicupin YhaK (pirin superfamily)
MNADAQIFAGLFDGDESARLELNPARKAYVHLVQGKLQVQGQQLEAGDALMLEGEMLLTLDRGIGAEVLVFDLAP